MAQPGIEPRSPGPVANTLTIMLISGTKATNRRFKKKRKKKEEKKKQLGLVVLILRLA